MTKGVYWKCLRCDFGHIEDECPNCGWHTRGEFDLLPQRTWVGLTWNDVPDEWVGKVAFIEGAKWADKQLKEKNT